MVTKFHNRPLKQKLSLIILLTSGILLLLATIASVTSDIFSFRRNLIAEMFTVADLIGINTAASVMFNTQETAEENMAGLRANPHLIRAHIFSTDGYVFASYFREASPELVEAVADKTIEEFYQPTHSTDSSATAENVTSTEESSTPTEANTTTSPSDESAEANTTTATESAEVEIDIPDSYFFRQNHLEVFKPIYFKNQRIGTIYLQSDLTALWERLFRAVGITVVVLLVSLLLGMVIAAKLQQVITAPIYHLLSTMEAVSTQNNYSLRAHKLGDDEIGKLIDGFNQMLGQIHDFREHLEEKVKQRTIDLAKARDQALAANKTKGIFLANISHEFRTPLNAVLGYTQLLQLDTNLTGEQRESLQIIEQAGNHLLDLINDILDMSKAEAGVVELRPDNFYLNELLSEMSAMFKANIELKQLQWHVENQLLPPDMVVYGDLGKLRQVLINLIGNAIKFTDYGGIRLRVSQSEEFCQLDVMDTGAGIAANALDNIFKPFYQETTGIAQGGTGLGLTICKQQVELMGGTLTVTSELGKGSCFSVKVPLPKVEDSLLVKTDSPSNHFRLAANSKVRALIAEEKKDTRILLTSMLRQVGVDVQEAFNGTECLEEVQAQPPQIIFFSMQLPLVTSTEIVRRLHADNATANLPCVAIVGSPAEGKQVITLGFNDFLQTPFRLTDIHNCLDKLLDIEFEYPDGLTPHEFEYPDGLTPHESDKTATTEITEALTKISTESPVIQLVEPVKNPSVQENKQQLLNPATDLSDLSDSFDSFMHFDITIDLKGAKVLMVDDTPENLKVLRKVLERDGYKVFFASDGQAAVKLTENILPDLILLDVMMPIMDGFETCRILKQRESTRNIPIIFLTAKHQTEDIVEAFSAGAVDFVNKPFRQEEVRMRVRTHLQAHLLTKQRERFLILATKAQKIAEQARVAAEAASHAKSAFLAKMSHELRTPLNAILGYTDMLQEEVEEAGYQDILPDLYKIQTAGESLLGIVSDILDLAKIEADKIDLYSTEFPINQLVTNLTTTLEPLINKENKLLINCSEQVGTVYTDRQKLQQILLNLINNANKFTQRGTITLQITRHVTIAPKADDGKTTEWLIFLVIDNGIGIPTDKFEGIFDAFSQADDSSTRAYGGTGLGLTISQHLAEALGGWIYVSSVVGKGSTFCLQLPARWS